MGAENEEAATGVPQDMLESLKNLITETVEKSLQPLMEARIAKQLADATPSEQEEAANNMETRSHVKDFSDPFAGVNGRKKTHRDDDEGLSFGRCVRALVAADGRKSDAVDLLRSWGDAATAKSLSTSILSEGGLFVPEAIASEIIDLLRGATVVMEAGATVLDMPDGNLTMPYATETMQPQYKGELGVIAVSTPKWEEFTLVGKELSGIVPISNKLIRQASHAMDVLVRNDMVASFASKRDTTFLRSPGTNNTPKGLLHSAATVTSRTQAAYPSTVQEITDDLEDMPLALENNNVPFTNTAYVMTPRTWAGLKKRRDSLGNYLWRDELNSGMLNGHRAFKTTEIPNNLIGPGGPGGGGGADKSEIYFCAFGHVMIGQVEALLIDAKKDATFVDGGGNVISGFSTNQSAVRGMEEHDIGYRYRGLEIVVTKDIDW